jgi:hypothetical protein
LQVLREHQSALSGFRVGIDSFPGDDDPSLTEHLSVTLENGALFADIVLRLPDVSQRLLIFSFCYKVLLFVGF